MQTLKYNCFGLWQEQKINGDAPFGFSIEDFKITSVHLENVKFFFDIKDIFSLAPYY